MLSPAIYLLFSVPWLECGPSQLPGWQQSRGNRDHRGNRRPDTGTVTGNVTGIRSDRIPDVRLLYLGDCITPVSSMKYTGNFLSTSEICSSLDSDSIPDPSHFTRLHCQFVCIYAFSRVFFSIFICGIWIRIRNTDPDSLSCWIVILRVSEPGPGYLAGAVALARLHLKYLF